MTFEKHTLGDGLRGGSDALEDERSHSLEVIDSKEHGVVRPETCAINTRRAESNYSPVLSFDDMGLKEELLRGIYTYGFDRPSSIQQRAIRPLVEKRDIIAQAQAGTGKTACFSIGLLQSVDQSLQSCQALILAPTRELAKQTETVARRLGAYLQISSYTVTGGADIQACIQALKEGPQLVVGTPGRVLDMIRRQVLSLSNLHYMVVDEADEMLSKGFKDQMYQIFQALPRETRVALFSATMPAEVLDMTSKFMAPDAVRFLVKREEQTLDGIGQFYVHVGHEQHKLDCLCELYERLSITQAIIFVNTRSKVDWLTERMHARDFTVSAVHSEMAQEDRSLIVEQFRSGAARVLIATDILARGIDVYQVNLVINYDLPYDCASYLHRIGRSGRFGRKGTAISLLTSKDIRQAREIERYYSTTIEELPRHLVLL